MDFDINQTLQNPAMFIAAIVAITQLARKHVFPGLDGRWVIVFGIGVALALKFGVSQLPANLVNDVVGTIILALTASGGIDTARGFLDRRSTGAITNSLISSRVASDTLWESPAGIFVAGLVSKLFAGNALMANVALSVLRSTVEQFANEQWERNVQVRLTAEVHRVLRGAGLIKTTSIPRTMVSLWITLLIAVIISGCAPVATSIGNAANADGAALTYTGSGVLFEAGSTDAESVVIDIQGEGIETFDPACTVEAFSVSCYAEKVAAGEGWELALSCDLCSAWATFFRPESLVPHTVFPE
jgi:hypothetical protein